MVGTPEYQVTRCSRIVRQKESALNLLGITTVPPESRVAMVDPINPWMWNSGMMHSETSSSERVYVFAIFADDTARLKCRKGTRLGRPVLPLVCRIRAMSSPVGAVAEAPVGEPPRRTSPFSLISTGNTGILRSAAALRANSAPTGGQSMMRAFVSPRKKRNSSYGYARFNGAAVPAIEAAR